MASRSRTAHIYSFLALLSCISHNSGNNQITFLLASAQSRRHESGAPEREITISPICSVRLIVRQTISGMLTRIDCFQQTLPTTINFHQRAYTHQMRLRGQMNFPSYGLTDGQE